LIQTAQNLAESAGNLIVLAGVPLLADPRGALYWAEQGLLAVADLHLEKGSSFAARGQLLPPYDTAATLARLSHLITEYTPRCVVALGDSFHDGDGPSRLGERDRTLANGGHMPVAAAAVHLGPPQLRAVGTWAQYGVMGSGTRLGWLGDWIQFPGLVGRFFPQAYSPGDLVSLVGLSVVLFLATRPRRAARARRAITTR